MTVINTNTASINAQYNLNKVNKEMEAAMEQLSSGKRINSAADDAAGLSISARMESQIKGLNQAIRNAADGQSMIDTTEGAHSEITNVLQRMRELAVQSANDTNVSSDRISLQSEIEQLANEIDRISGQTTWNGTALMDGSFAGKQLQIGADTGQVISFSVDNTSSSALGSFTLEGTAVYDGVTDSANEITASTLVVSGKLGSANVTIGVGSSAKDAALAINAKESITGVAASAVTKAELSAVSAVGTFSFNLIGNASASAAISVNVSDVSNLTGLRDAINEKSGVTGITAAFGSDTSKIIMTHLSGEDIKLENLTHATTTVTMSFQAFDKNGSGVATAAATLAADGANDAVVVGQLSLESTKSFTVSGDDVTATEGFFTAVGGASTSGGTATISNIANVNIATVAGAQSAISAIDGALNKISEARSNLGAISNRLDHTMSNLGNISMNTQASQSRIQDADFAKVTGDLTKSQIMSQAATAMLAQANASKQGVLSLLQG